MFRILVLALLVVTMRISRGVDSCWSGPYTEDLCCDTDQYGPRGNLECWEGTFSYATCCNVHRSNAPPVANDPIILDVSSMELGYEAAPHAEREIADSCWDGVFTEELCCDVGEHGPEGNTVCWSGNFDFERCCQQSADGRAAQDFGLDASPVQESPASVDKGAGSGKSQKRAVYERGGHEVARTCWRGGYNFYTCCRRDRPGGNPQCWDGEMTYERCCHPPGVTRAALLFEDINCERMGDTWEMLRDELQAITLLMGQGKLKEKSERFGGLSAWARALERRMLSAPLECSLGRVAVRAAVLLLCIAMQGAERCRVEWAGVAKAMRGNVLEITQWTASNWPVLGLFKHISLAVGAITEMDASCLDKNGAGIRWQVLHESAKSTESPSREVMHHLFDAELWKNQGTAFNAACEGGQQWVATLKMNWCARSEVKCVTSYSVFLDWKLRQAASSGAALRKWASRAGVWWVHTWQYEVLQLTMRHHFRLGLNEAELHALGVTATSMPAGCTRWSLQSMLHAPLTDGTVDRHLERCRALCGWSQDEDGNPWLHVGYNREGQNCICARASPSELLDPDRMNCSSLPGHVLLYSMPPRRSSQELLQDLLYLGPSTPVLSQAAGSVTSFDPNAPVFTTMVFGHMARHLHDFSERIRHLKIPNVVVFVLDSDAERECTLAQQKKGPQAFCLRGTARNALQKYIVVLVYLVLGWDVFWFDFDSVWLQNPAPILQAQRREHPEAEVFSAIDFDSTNCAMNAFFMVRATESAITWLLSLMHWIYKRPYAHDQVAFTTLLGIGPLVDDDPLPTPPKWTPLDPNIFANAARFAGLGFSAPVNSLVLFHFFDGWNSGQPGKEVEDHATPTYRGQNLFEVLYSDDQAAARAAIAKSRLPPPAEFRDCRYMTDLGLGVEITEDEGVEIPIASTGP